uniref:Uncharacterized protein n=1 Tax=Corethron hystrix TaxID=216773 RepID=A0A7S1C0X7_9STRA
MGRTWVLLVDVDEYMVFNAVHEDDPPLPMKAAPEGIPTLEDWSWSYAGDGIHGRIDYGDGQKKMIETGDIDESQIYYAGFVIEDDAKAKYFLRDDLTYYNQTGLDEAPPGVPTLRRFYEGDYGIVGYIYGDKNKTDGERLITDGWGGEIGKEKYIKRFGGQVFTDNSGNTYFLEKEQRSFPPHLEPALALEVRRHLPKTRDGATVQDVLNEVSKGPLGELGPCLSMPRLRYSSKEEDDIVWSKEMGSALKGFDANNFATFQFRHHASKHDFATNKYGKTIIDVSRVGVSHFKDSARSIHFPLSYLCRNDFPPYSTSLFRVNHYLDSWEAHSYRQDVRASRRCRECYDVLTKDADVGKDNDIQGWLQYFVEHHGALKASELLNGAGDFVPEKIDVT